MSRSNKNAKISNLLVFCRSRSGTKFVEVVLGFVLTPEHTTSKLAVGEGKKLHRTHKTILIPNVKWSLVKLEHLREIVLSLHQTVTPDTTALSSTPRFSSPCKRVYQVSALKTLLFGSCTSKETKYLHIAFLGNRESQC